MTDEQRKFLSADDLSAEADMLLQACRLLKKHNVKCMADFPPEAWQEWVEIGMGLDYSRESLEAYAYGGNK